MSAAPIPLATHSFLDVQANMSGPGIAAVNLGAGAANAEEGISVEMVEETDTMKGGADGSQMHSLHASKAARAMVRLLKTSPINSILDAAYRYQRQSGLFWGKNIIVIANPVTGDKYTLSQVAFVKHPNNTWDKEGPMLEWEFNVGVMEPVVGSLLGAI